MNKENPDSLDREVSFCSACFATNEDGSWGTNGWSVEDVQERGLNCYCINCAGHGEIVVISRRVAEKIRQSASWVGKRYYPDTEDLVHTLHVNVPDGICTVKWRLDKGARSFPGKTITPYQTTPEEALCCLNESIHMYYVEDQI